MGFFNPFEGSSNNSGQVEIEVDKTLSKEGMAADSKTVGDKVNTINEKVRVLEEEVLGNSVLIVDDIQDTEEYVEENLSLDEVEKEMIRKALERHHGRRKNAAKDLKISERTLYRKIKEYGLE